MFKRLAERRNLAGLWVVTVISAAILTAICVALMNYIASSTQDAFAKADRYPARSEALFALQQQAQKLPGVERADEFEIGPSEAFTGKQIFAYVDFSDDAPYAQVAGSIKQIKVDPNLDPSIARIYVIARFDGNELGLTDDSALNQSRLDFVSEAQTQPGVQTVTVKRQQSDDNGLYDRSNDGLYIAARVNSTDFDQSLFEQTVKRFFQDSSVDIIR